jgi:hypothetical protein
MQCKPIHAPDPITRVSFLVYTSSSGHELSLLLETSCKIPKAFRSSIHVFNWLLLIPQCMQVAMLSAGTNVYLGRA